MSLTPSSKNNPCPICENTAGKCRQSREDENYWQCMSYADAKKADIISGFKCIGHTRDRLWGQFKLDSSQEWSEQQRLDWQQENQRRRQEKVKEDSERRRRSLTTQQRHEQYTRLFGELTLHPDDRADLLRRGFTHQQIELSGFKSIRRYQQLRSRYSDLLPGISRGSRLIIADEGYLCPVRNADGLIIACQVRLRTLPTTETNRYRWLNGGGQTLHLYPEGGKGEGELPLPVFKPQGKPEGIALAEGTGAKPFLVSQRLNLFTIGAAGGQWASSPELFRETLEKAALEVKGKSIKIFPDAGDILNPSVMTRWQRVITLLEEWGWSVAIGWWGQADKSHPDIDELKLSEYSQIHYLNPSEFWELAKTKPTEQKKGFSKDYQEKAKEAWLRSKQFIADIKKASEWCDWKLPPSNSIFLGKAGLGRGKTTRLRNWVRSWQEEDKGFICLGYRNTLLLQLCEKLGFYHLHEGDAAIMRRNPNGGIALCVDSLWRFKPEEFDNKILILDEVMSVIKHLLHSPTIKVGSRDKILELFQEALQRASQVVCLDGCLADWAVKYLHELAPDKKIIRAENTFQGDKPTVNFLLGTLVEEQVRKNDRSPWLDHLLNNSPVPAICSDSQIFIESLDSLLTEKGLRALRVDSKTVPEEHVREFLKDCDAYIEKHQPDAILYTPSAESGVDISIRRYFTHHFSFFFGVLGVDGILQMLGRIRDADCTKFVWVREWVAQSEQTHSKSPFQKQVAKAIEQTLCRDITDTISGIDQDKDIIAKLLTIIQSSKNPHFDASNQIQAISNYEKSNLRECVLESLEASGYPIRLCTLNPSEETRERVKAATETTKRQNCHEIFTAEKIAPEFADELSKKFDARWEDRVKVIQASYRSRLPGIDESESWTEDFIYKIRYENPDFISQQELFWLFFHPEEANRMNLERYHRIAQKERTFIGNVRSRMARVRALRDIGFEQFLDPEKTWMEDSPELVALVKRCKDEKIAAALGRHPGQQTNIRFLGSLLKMLGLKHKGQKVKSADGDYRVYRLDRDTLSDPDRVNALNCLDTRWQTYLTKEVEILDWEQVLSPVTGPQETAEIEPNSAACPEQAKTQMQQALEAVPRTPSEYIYTLKASWNQSDQVESQEVGEPLGAGNLLERLTVSLRYCHTERDFALVVEGFHASSEQVEDAIALQDSMPVRQQLRAWHEAAVGAEAIVVVTPEELAEAFEYCDELSQFVVLVEGYDRELIEEAIALQPNQPSRQRLRDWWEELAQSSDCRGEELAHPEAAITTVTAEELAEAFEYCEEPSQFAAVAEGYSRELIEQAIALQDTQPRRQQLRVWYEARVADDTASETQREKKPIIEGAENTSDWRETIKTYGQLLTDGFEYGIEAFKDLIKPWTQEERWGAIQEFERNEPEKMERLVAIAPDWIEWCLPNAYA